MLRRCVGCGERVAKCDLRRVVLIDGRVRADPSQRAPGRGAYVCGRACAQRAISRAGFARSFRSAVRIDRDLVDSL
ncbi:MAG: YlxR family protein [Solirubrobacteraceae bacterium]